MASVDTVATLDGLFKKIYAEKLQDLIPDNAKCVKMINFQQNKKLGSTYEQPVVLANEHGVTYAAAGSGAFSLNTAIAMTTKNASVPSAQMLLRASIGYEAASKAATAGERAFVQSTQLVIKNMLSSITHRLEADILYGVTGLGKTSSSANASATSTVVTLTTATWGVGIWSGAENSIINFYESTTIVSGSTGDFTINSVDVTNKALTITGVAADITLLDAKIADTGVVALDIFWKGSYGNQLNGIDKIVTNTGSLFGISAADYNLWAGNSYAAAGTLSLAKVLDHVNDAVGKGGLDESVTLMIAPPVWADLASELAAYRRFDSSYKRSKGDWGFETLEIASQNGSIKVMAHPMVKIGDGFSGPMNTAMRIGSTDITFNNPGTGDRFFRELNDNAGFELRCYEDQSFFIECPAKWTKISGITT